jgi:hypothetical protein
LTRHVPFKAAWEEQQKSHQKELEELQARVADLKVCPSSTHMLRLFTLALIHAFSALQGQNEVLHNHLQALTSKAAQIQAAASEVPEGFAPSGEEKTIEELRQLVGYLKKEREIVECKHELAQQEATRYVHTLCLQIMNLLTCFPPTGTASSGSTPPAPSTKCEPSCTPSKNGNANTHDTHTHTHTHSI